MSRRSRSKKSSGNKSNLIVYLIIGIAVIGAIVVGKIMITNSSRAFSDSPVLPISEYMENANSFANNEYRVRGKITEKLHTSSEHGQLIWLHAEQDDDQSGHIAIKIPPGVSSINLERGQSYTFKIRIERDGSAVALDVIAG